MEWEVIQGREDHWRMVVRIRGKQNRAGFNKHHSDRGCFAVDYQQTLPKEDEIETLRAIYGDDLQLSTGTGSNVYTITVSSPDGRHMNVQITCPDGYPTTSSPVYELRNSEWLDDTDILLIVEQLTQVYKDHEGEVIVYQLIECIREYITTKINVSREPGTTVAAAGDDIQLTPQNDDDGVLCTYTTEPSFSPESQGPNVERHLVSDCADSSKLKQCPDIVHGEPLTDRKSTFQAHAAAVTTKQEVAAFVVELKKNKKIASATHNILAYRLLDSSKGVLVQDCDDDGESAAGGRLLHLLQSTCIYSSMFVDEQMMDVKNAVVVVSRWYGGILLHGDRFKHINNVARILLQETGVGLGLQYHSPQQKEAKSIKTKGKRTKL